MTAKSLEIVCRACGKETLVRREPVYEGFKKVGEQFLCMACGHVYESEDEVPFKADKRAAVFSEADRLRKVEVFRNDEKGRNCRYCEHYVVNPFVQRCGLHIREVQATDTCADFKKKPAPKPAAGPGAPGGVQSPPGGGRTDSRDTD